MITLIANAKINLFLDIINKRPDGYHNLETVMQSIDLSDILTVELADEISVECSDPTVPQNEGNICHKAAELFYALFAKKGGAEIFIEKRIPHGAGLGGGSADAFMLTGPSTKITNLGALKIVLGLKHFVLYLAFVMIFSFATGMIVNLII